MSDETALRLLLAGDPAGALAIVEDADAKQALLGGMIGTALELLRAVVGEDPVLPERTGLSF